MKNLLGDADLIAHFLNAQGEHLKGRIQGGKRINRGFGYEVGDQLEIEYSIQEGQDFIKLSHHQGLRIQSSPRGYRAMLALSLAMELISRMAQRGLAEGGLFDLLQQNLTFTWDREHWASNLITLIWRLLTLSGVQIRYQACLSCGQPSFIGSLEEPKFRKSAYRLIPTEGGIQCERCAGAGNWGAPMIKLLWLLDQGQNLAEVPEELLYSMIRDLLDYLPQHYQFTLNSLPLLARELGWQHH